MFTIDENCLIRLWDLEQGICIRSYPLEVPSSAKDGDIDDNLDKFKTRYHISTMKLSDDNRVFVVALQGGILQLNNAYSGAILYNKAYENMIEIENEVAGLSFFRKKTNMWVAATAWSGAVAFIQRPLTNKGPEVVRWDKMKTSHKKDVTCLDITDSNQMVTASLDNLIVFWNSYSRKEAKRIQIPEDMASKHKGNSVHAVKFASKDNDDFVLVFMSNGEIFVVDRQSETFLDPPDSEDGSKLISTMSFGRVPAFSVIDFADGLILSVSENGDGTLHRTAIVQAPHSTGPAL